MSMYLLWFWKVISKNPRIYFLSITSLNSKNKKNSFKNPADHLLQLHNVLNVQRWLNQHLIPSKSQYDPRKKMSLNNDHFQTELSLYIYFFYLFCFFRKKQHWRVWLSNWQLNRMKKENLAMPWWILIWVEIQMVCKDLLCIPVVGRSVHLVQLQLLKKIYHYSRSSCVLSSPHVPSTQLKLCIDHLINPWHSLWDECDYR